MNVWQVRYHNDQPIVDSAWFFSGHIGQLTQLGVSEIGVVAHSMGGLVSREMLTNPQIAFVERARTGTVPRVVGLIKVGTRSVRVFRRTLSRCQPGVRPGKIGL